MKKSGTGVRHGPSFAGDLYIKKSRKMKSPGPYIIVLSINLLLQYHHTWFI